MDPFNTHLRKLQETWGLIEKYSAELTPAQKKAADAGADINQLPSFVPYARIGKESVPLVGKKNLGRHYKGGDVYYGYESLEKAVERINQAKTLPVGQEATGWFIGVMYGDKTVKYYDEYGDSLDS